MKNVIKRYTACWSPIILFWFMGMKNIGKKVKSDTNHFYYLETCMKLLCDCGLWWKYNQSTKPMVCNISWQFQSNITYNLKITTPTSFFHFRSNKMPTHKKTRSNSISSKINSWISAKRVSGLLGCWYKVINTHHKLIQIYLGNLSFWQFFGGRGFIKFLMPWWFVI